ncbi:VIR protein, partial [Plasmodium vivax]
YPFFEDLWKMYDTFAKSLNEEDDRKHSSVCNEVRIYKGDHVEKQKNTCKLLLRNSFLLYDRNYGSDVLFKYCDILYIWLYFEIRKNNFSSSIIDQIFNESIQMISRQQKTCPYYSYSEYLHEPEKLMKLRIFNYNIENIKKILNNIDEPNNCSCLKYVYECINIYKNIHRNYCVGEKKSKNSNTCSIVDEFGTKYNFYIYNIKNEIYKLPSLLDINDVSKGTYTHIADCTLNGKRPNSNNNNNQAESYTQSNVTKVLGSMIGISSFLAISFK